MDLRMTEILLHQLHDTEACRTIIKDIRSLFKRWKLHPINQAELLGLTDISDLNPEVLLDDTSQIIDRICHLLSIEQALTDLYPGPSARRDRWVWRPRPELYGQTPMAVMLHDGMDGIKYIRRMLQSASRS